MQKNSFGKELAFGIVFILIAILSGLTTSYWMLSFFLWSVVYILWKWVEFYYFYKWYMNGAKLGKAPLSSGIWEDLSTQVIKNRKHNKKVISDNKHLLHRFNVTAQALPYATILVNNQLEITWCNHQAQKLLGIFPHKDYGSRLDNIIRAPEFVNMLHSESDSEEIKLDNPLDDSKKVHLKRIKLSGDSFLIVGRDISEQESLRKSRKAFVDNASHELRTPLTVITGYLEMLLGADDIAKHWKAGINNAKSQADRMERIISDMLKLSSMEHERYLERSDEVINMPELLNTVFNDIKNSSGAEQYELLAEIDSELDIFGDEEEIVGLVSNLLKNAINHNPKGTQIRLTWLAQKDRALLSVCDNGRGIDEKHIPHLTERFYRIDNSKDKNFNSTGLGLAIVKQICQNHEAELNIQSKLNEGTCFKVEFPQIRIC
ncbi:MAG: phosphate regulon sensor histidine kinase PhoR [Gammaproteobacteria bacterium]|jgi:two-component system phosphate regulon sensor histidine kinase PhoR|nr:phosphate regulon sensor histidine kinase PhoR [Xanthomonadales bacterium]